MADSIYAIGESGGAMSFKYRHKEYGEVDVYVVEMDFNLDKNTKVIIAKATYNMDGKENTVEVKYTTSIENSEYNDILIVYLNKTIGCEINL